MESIKKIIQNKSNIKLPAHPWQELALRVISDLKIPNFKRSSVFKICKEYDKIVVEKCLNDTKELVKEGEPWKYFFKLIGQLDKH